MRFAAELTEGHPTLAVIALSLLVTRATLRRESKPWRSGCARIARTDMRARLLMTTSVSMIVALTYGVRSTIRRGSSRQKLSGRISA